MGSLVGRIYTCCDALYICYILLIPCHLGSVPAMSGGNEELCLWSATRPSTPARRMTSKSIDHARKVIRRTETVVWWGVSLAEEQTKVGKLRVARRLTASGLLQPSSRLSFDIPLGLSSSTLTDYPRIPVPQQSCARPPLFLSPLRLSAPPLPTPHLPHAGPSTRTYSLYPVPTQPVM